VNGANLEEYLRKSKPRRELTRQVTGGAWGRRFRAGARQIVRFEKGPLGAADVAYMSQIGDIFDIVQQIAKSIP
jgi:hypothetical protein